MTRAVEDSKKINDVTSPCIILSASGMATGGRVLHHLAKRLPDSRSAVLIVGYQAVGTLGRQIEDGSKLVKIFGEMVPVRAEVVDLPQLSAHAGRSELLKWLSGIQGRAEDDFYGPRRACSARVVSRRGRFNLSLASYGAGIRSDV